MLDFFSLSLSSNKFPLPPFENLQGLPDCNLPIKSKQKALVFICFWSSMIVYTTTIFNLKINFNFASSTSKLGYTPKMWYLRRTLFKYLKYTPSYDDYDYAANKCKKNLWQWFKNKSIILEQIIYIQNTE